MKRIFLINFFIFIIGIFLIIIFFKLINFFVSGPPRYYELVYNLEKGNIKSKIEKLVSYKLNKNSNAKDDFHKYNLQGADESEYTGGIVDANCGSLESGLYELYFATDKNGFRENKDNLYDKTDFILLGDSFVMSICENKPFDLKSQIKKLNNNYKYLNLGVHNINYVKQLSILTNISKNTDFNGLIWFFYEGNDYNDSLSKYEKYNSFQTYQEYQYHNGEFNYKLPDFNKKKDYYIKKQFEFSHLYKLKVWAAELVNGISSLVKYFKDYEILLDKNEYNEALKLSKNYLDRKKIKKRYIYYIPSWQRLTNYKSKKIGYYKKNPQIQQLDQLKNSVKKISEKNGFIFVDGEDLFINLNKPLDVFHYGLNTHFNRKGYELLAKDINEKILGN